MRAVRKIAETHPGYKRAVRRTITLHEEVRRRCGYGVVELAVAAGFSHAYVSRVEAGELRPSPRYRAAISKVLRVPEDLIFDNAGIEPADHDGNATERDP